EDAEEVLERMRRRWRDSRDRFTGDSFAAALLGAGHLDDARSVANEVLHVFPDSISSWQTLGSALFLSGATDEAIEAANQGLAVASERDGAQLHRIRAWSLLTKNNMDSVPPTIEYLRAFLADGEAEMTLGELRRSIPEIARTVQECVRKMDLSAEEKAR